MAESVSAQDRRAVRSRAGLRCEYCMTPEWALMAGCEVDHIISRKHGGVGDLSNLALSCARCNRAKGSDVGSLSPTTGQFVRLFNPRTDEWRTHFRVEGARVAGLTEIGQATASLLRFNAEERMLERVLLQMLGEVPLS